MNRVALVALAVLAVCVLAVTLAVLVVPPSLSWAAVLEALTTQAQGEGACVFTGQ